MITNQGTTITIERIKAALDAIENAKDSGLSFIQRDRLRDDLDEAC